MCLLQSISAKKSSISDAGLRNVRNERANIASVRPAAPGRYKNHSYGQNKIASQITRCSSAENLLAINMKFSDLTGFKIV